MRPWQRLKKIKPPDERLLLPVNLVREARVAVLAVSRAMRPGALKPQLLAVLNKKGTTCLLIRKPDRVTYVVTPCNAAVSNQPSAYVTAFKREWKAGYVDLSTVYARLENKELAELKSIAMLLAAKGLTVD